MTNDDKPKEHCLMLNEFELGWLYGLLQKEIYISPEAEEIHRIVLTGIIDKIDLVYVTHFAKGKQTEEAKRAGVI